MSKAEKVHPDTRKDFVDHLFKSYKDWIIDSSDIDSAWERALVCQEKYWDLLGGRTIDILKLKFLAQGYDPRVFVMGKVPYNLIRVL